MGRLSLAAVVTLLLICVSLRDAANQASFSWKLASGACYTIHGAIINHCTNPLRGKSALLPFFSQCSALA